MDVQLSKETWTRKELRWAKGLFLRAFPPEERPPFWVMTWRSKQNVDWWKVFADGKLVGFLYILVNKELAYIFHFAIDEAARSKGVGTMVLRKLTDLYTGRKFFLAIEQLDPSAPNLPERVARKNFYLRCGMRELHQRVQEGEVIYDLLGTGGQVTDAQYQSLLKEWIAWPYACRVTMKVLD